MKIKHNKKRNTAFVFEALIKEITIAILKENSERRDAAIAIVKEHFSPDTILFRHLQCYRSLYENQNLSQETSEKILKEAKLASRLLDKEGLFKSQTELIKDVNKELTPKFFNNFVPNYKTLATIDQIFSDKLSPSACVMLEGQLTDMMCQESDPTENAPVDDVVVSSFVNRFNTKYDTELLENQKTLLNNYISAFSDNALSLKMFLVQEITRLRARKQDMCNSPEILKDADMLQKTEQVFEKLEAYQSSPITDDMILAILRTQQLEQEIFENGD